MSLNYYLQQFTELNVDDLYQILKLRTQVFVVEQTCAYQDLDGMDQQAWHLSAKNSAGALIAYARILPPIDVQNSHSSIGRVVVSQSARDKQYGRQLMQKAIEITRDKYPENPLKISAQTYLSQFYQSLGFINTGHYYLEDDIPHQEMLFQTN